MALTKIKCIHCESEEVVKNGKRATGIQSLNGNTKLKMQELWEMFSRKLLK